MQVHISKTKLIAFTLSCNDSLSSGCYGSHNMSHHAHALRSRHVVLKHPPRPHGPSPLVNMAPLSQTKISPLLSSYLAARMQGVVPDRIGADSARPWRSVKDIRRICAEISNLGKYFVNMSAGFSLPGNLPIVTS